MEKIREKYLRCRPASIAQELDEGRLGEDLLRYVSLARELGVSDAAIVDKESWYLDERVTLKCAVPRCPNYNTCANCPPHSSRASETAKIIEGYSKGICSAGVSPEIPMMPVRHTGMPYSVIAAIERLPFDGYYLATALAQVPAAALQRNALSETDGTTRAVAIPPLSPSMEAVGFDVYRTAGRAGWAMNPAGSLARRPSRHPPA
ncbi:MAG: DUF2284 domain-containing protein [Syntrophales bacterium LBB04]|nr:DUF2284 domain-containing protein [Syntrophales bacterium LBB04]